MGLFVNFSVMAVMVFSASLYLDAKQRLKCPSTFTAVAQECIGNISSFLINFIIAFCIFGVITLYSILFSRMCITLFGGQPDSIWGKKSTFVILLCLIQLSQVARKNMSELKIGTYMLFTGVLCLLLVMQIKLK